MSSPCGPSDVGIENCRADENGAAPNRICCAGTSLRSDESCSTYRSSPQNTSTADQSTGESGSAANACQTFSMIEPAVSASAARPCRCCASASTSMTCAATSAASSSAEGYTMTSGIGGQCGVVPDVRAHRGSRAQVGLAGHRAECLGVGFVRIEPAQLFGEQVAGRPRRERRDRVELVRPAHHELVALVAHLHRVAVLELDLDGRDVLALGLLNRHI